MGFQGWLEVLLLGGVPMYEEAGHITLIAANPWERMVPELGVMVNSFGFIVGPSSLAPASPWWSGLSSQFEMLGRP